MSKKRIDLSSAYSGMFEGLLFRLISVILSALFSLFRLLAPVVVVVYAIKNFSIQDIRLIDAFVAPYFALYIFGVFFAFPLAYGLYYFRTLREKAQSKLSDLDSWTGQYVRVLISKNFVGFLLVSLSAEAYREITGDRSAYTAVIVYLLSAGMYLGIVLFRVKCRFFGLNSTEAEELLDFLYGKNSEDDGGRPRRMHAQSVDAMSKQWDFGEAVISKSNSSDSVRIGAEHGLV